jgi:hypothetical protein
LHSGGWDQGPLYTAATKWSIVPAPGDYDNGEIGGMIGRGNRSTRRKPAQMPPCPPQTPHAARTRTRAAAVGSQRLTAELRHGHVRVLAQLVTNIIVRAGIALYGAVNDLICMFC